MSKEKKQRWWKWTWFKISLLVLLVLFVLLYGTCTAALAKIEANAVPYDERQSVIVITTYGDKLTLTKMANALFLDAQFSLAVEWEDQRLYQWKEDRYPAGASAEDWYTPLEETEIHAYHHIYQFTWGTVIIENGELRWELNEAKRLGGTA